LPPARHASAVRSVSSVAHELPAGRPPLPSWGAAIASAFFGAFLAYFCLGVVALAGAKLGLLSLDIARPVRDGLRDWPYPEAGRLSLAANAVVWVWVLALTALVVARLLARSVRRPVSAVMVFGVLAVTGFAPFLPRGLLDPPWLVALLLTARPAAARLRLRAAVVPRRVTVAAFAVGVVLLAIPVLHALRHPLWPTVDYVRNQPAKNAVTLSLRNMGSADVELEAVSLRTPAWVPRPVEVVDVRADDSPPLGPDPPIPPIAAQFESPRLPFTAEGGTYVYVQLRLEPRGCGTGTLPATADIAYRVRGAKHVQTFAVPITLRSPARRLDVRQHPDSQGSR
jgi:hypothetical protein